MVLVLSNRARRLKEEGLQKVKSPLMKKFSLLHWQGPTLWVEVKKKNDQIVEVLFFGESSEFSPRPSTEPPLEPPLEPALEDYQVVLLLAIAQLAKNKSSLRQLQLREIEAYLRDLNSTPAIEGLTSKDEEEVKRLLDFIEHSPVEYSTDEHSLKSWSIPESRSETSSLLSANTPFHEFNLIQKISAIRAFLNSPEVVNIYHNMTLPRLINIEEETIFVSVSYKTDHEKECFFRLHELGVKVFRDENLNFIPED